MKFGFNRPNGLEIFENGSTGRRRTPARCVYYNKLSYTPNGYIVPAEFCVNFLPRMKNIPKQTKLHLNEIGLTKIEFCKRKI